MLPARASIAVLRCFCTVGIFTTVFAITEQEMQACEALLRNNPDTATFSGGRFNASRCCSDLQVGGLIFYCSEGETAITSMYASFERHLFRIVY
jgi:hypothetical protein